GPALPPERLGQGMGFLSEDRKTEGLALALPIATNIALPQLAPHLRAGLLRPRRLERAARAVGERVHLRCHSVRQPAGELSGGNQQKVAIARLLHAGCRVLLLDEPTRGIDVGSRQEIYRLLDAAARDGVAILVVSSHLPELLGLCDRIAVMRRGALSAFRPAAEWTQEALLHAAMAGAAAAAAEVLA
ncbi:MAG: sugar ABC transporter ATP-binding protein, partial [Planctomycetes bacterium]|nr:sugar ABC transporter ATP-binding protein [Planctomycetota bacterium]